MAMRGPTYAEVKEQFGSDVDALRRELVIATSCNVKLILLIDAAGKKVPVELHAALNEVLAEAAGRSVLEAGTEPEESMN